MANHPNRSKTPNVSIARATCESFMPWHFERAADGQFTVNTKRDNGDGIRVAYIAPQAYASMEAIYAKLIAACPALVKTLQEIECRAQELAERGGKFEALEFAVFAEEAREALAKTMLTAAQRKELL